MRVRASLASLGALLVGVLIAFHEVLGSKTALLLRDHQLVFRPRWWAIRESVLAGEIPALTIGGHGGIPIEQLMNGTFTPGSLVFLLGPFEVVYDIFVVVHFAALGIGAYLLAIRLGATRAAALAAGGFAMLAGPVVSSESLVINLIGIAYVPWVLLSWRLFLEDTNRKNVALLALAIGFQAQAIIPSTAIIDLLGAVAIAWHLRWRPDTRALGGMALAGALGLGVASIGLFPALEGLASTTRGRGFEYAMSSGWAVSPAMFLEYITPNFWAPTDYPFLNPGNITGNATDAPYFPSLYFGVAIPLIVAGGARRSRLWLVFGLLLFAIIAMGKYAPLHRYVATLPLLSSSRYAVKYTVIVMLFGSALVALGIGEMDHRPRLLRVVTAVHVAITAAVLLTVGTEYWASQMFELHGPGAERWSLLQDLPRITIIAQDLSVGRARHAFGAAVALFFVLHINVVRPNRRTWMKHIAATIVIADLAFAATYVVVGLDLQKTTLPAAITETIVADRTARYFVPPYEAGPTIDLQQPGALEQVMKTFGRRGQLETPGARRFEDLALDGQSHHFHTAMSRLAQSLEPGPRDLLLARVGVRHIGEKHNGELRLRQLPHRPYVGVYGRFRSFDPAKWRPADYVEFLSDENNADVGLVEFGPTSQTSTSACARPPTITSNLVGINGPFEATVEAPCPTIIVLQEIVKRGWSVEVDGQQKEVFATDAGYVSTALEPGRHHVRFVYRSLAAQWAPMTLASLLFVVLMLATHRRSKAAG